MQILQQTIDGELMMVNFDYAALSQEKQIYLRNQETRIKNSMADISNEFYKIGLTLLETKGELPHGQFELWVEKSLPFGQRQAEHLMNIAKDPNANNYSAFGFSLSVQKQLAAPSTPVEVKEAIIQQAEAGQTITADTVKAATIQATTRFCPNCNGQQVIKAKAMQHNNGVQCANCKAHYKATEWLTVKRTETWRHCRGCNSLWRKINGLVHISYDPERLKIFNCTEEKYCPVCEKQQKKIKPILHCTACNRLWQEKKNGEADYRHSPAGTIYKDFEQKSCPECANNPKRYCPNCGHEARVRAGAGYFTTCIHCLTGHKYEEWLTEPRQARYCLHCNEKRLIPLDYFEKAYFVLCKNKACGKEERAEDWLTEPRQTRFCPECHAEKKILVAANNFETCEGCKKLSPSEKWLTEKPQKPDAPSQTVLDRQTRYCPECHEKQEILSSWLENETLMAQGIVKCNQCEKTSPLNKWLTDQLPEWLQGDDPLPLPPPAPAAPEPEWITKFCPNCGNQGKFLASEADYNAMGCGKCGKVIMKGGWLEQPPKQMQTVTKQLTTPMNCPECHQKQEVLSTWLENETILDKGMLKCEQCQKTSPLKAWQKQEITAVTVVEQTAAPYVWTEEDLRHGRGELKKMFGGLVMQYCTSEAVWYTFDQILLKIRHHLSHPNEPSHLAKIDQLLTPKGARFVTSQEIDNEIYRLRGAVADSILDLSIHKLNKVLGFIKQVGEE